MSALAQAPPDSARLALLPPLFLGFGRNTVYWRAWRFILTIAHRINFLIAALKLEIFLSLPASKPVGPLALTIKNSKSLPTISLAYPVQSMRKSAFSDRAAGAGALPIWTLFQGIRNMYVYGASFVWLCRKIRKISKVKK
jgi:hypothetical protein